MADNYAATQGAGTNFAADDVGGVLYPRLKLALGADGAADMDLDSGQQTMANSVPVALASDQDFMKAEDAAHVTGDKGIMLLAVRKDTAAALAGTDADYIPLIVDASGRLHVAPLVAGSAAIGKLAANSGVDIGDVDVTSVVPGTGATALGKAEDVAHVTGDTGVMLLAVRQDTAAALAGADGDYIPVTTDSLGRLRIAVSSGVTGTFASAVSMSTVVAAIKAATAGRKKLSVHHNGGSRVYLGFDNTTTAGQTGKNIGWLDAGDAWSEEYAGAIWGITETGTAYVTYMEVA